MGWEMHRKKQSTIQGVIFLITQDVLKCPFFLLKYMLKNVMIVITQKESKTCAVCPFYFHRNPFIYKDS